MGAAEPSSRFPVSGQGRLNLVWAPELLLVEGLKCLDHRLGGVVSIGRGDQLILLGGVVDSAQVPLNLGWIDLRRASFGVGLVK